MTPADWAALVQLPGAPTAVATREGAAALADLAPLAAATGDGPDEELGRLLRSNAEAWEGLNGPDRWNG